MAHRADYLEQLKLVHDELGFERVRFHGIFNDNVELAAFRRENGNIVLMLYAQNFEETDKTYPVTIRLQNAPEFSCVTAKRVNSVSGNPVRLWNEMGKPSVCTRDEIAQLHDASQIITENLPILPDGAISIHIEENEVVLLELHRADGGK